MTVSAPYDVTCPTCGGQMVPVALGPDSAPWACHRCRYSFWVSELTPAARAAWMPGYQAHRPREREGIERGILSEQAAAWHRGTSGLPEHLPLLSAGHLRALRRLANPANEEWVAMVDAALEAAAAREGQEG